MSNLNVNKYIFISYLRDDKVKIERIRTYLDHYKVPYWIDRKDLEPGKNWKISIHEAIESGALFISFFSNNYFDRESSYMNEELNVAIESLRKRPHNTSWFIPSRLDDCNIPKILIAGGSFISDIQAVDFYKDFDKALDHLLDVIVANGIPCNRDRPKPNAFNELELKYLSLKALIDNGEGRYFHNNDMGHPVYFAGALGRGAEPWEYADGPDRNVLYKKLKTASTNLNNSEINVDQFVWWYDFNSWVSFCRYVVKTYKRLQS